MNEDERCEMELEYIANWKLGLDLTILLKIMCPFFKTLKKSEYAGDVLANDEMQYLSDYYESNEPLDYDESNYDCEKHKKLYMI